jgi:hypothetical protein
LSRSEATGETAVGTFYWRAFGHLKHLNVIELGVVTSNRNLSHWFECAVRRLNSGALQEYREERCPRATTVIHQTVIFRTLKLRVCRLKIA